MGEGIAHNDLENHPSAECLIRISRTKTNKGLHEAARLYLNVLRDDLTYGDWAEAGLERLREDPVVLEPEIVTARSLMLIQDDVDSTQVPLPNGKTSSFSAEQVFLSLLERNPRNRMAFEYLMASHLLSGNVVGVVAA